MSSIQIIDNAFYLYSLIIFIVIFLYWIPSVDKEKQPVKFMRDITEPYLEIFRRIIPPINGLDLSPIVALIALDIIKTVIIGILATFLR